MIKFISETKCEKIEFALDEATYHDLTDAFYRFVLAIGYQVTANDLAESLKDE